MNQSPITIDQQIALLKSRGMNFADVAKAKDILARISYFRLKYYWKDLVEDLETGDFQEGTTFNQVLRRYEFDHRLKLILFEAIIIIEVALKTKFIHYLSMMKGDGLWYLDSSLFEDKNYQEEVVLGLKEEFDRSDESFVIEYLYGNKNWQKNSLEGSNPDAWMIMEMATFGKLSKLYKNLKTQLPARASIANDFGLYSAKDFTNWIETIYTIRNIIAHHGRLWNRTFRKQIVNAKCPSGRWLNTPLTDNQRRKPYGMIAAMVYLCKTIKPENELNKNILRLVCDFPDLPVFKLGFLHGWQEEPLWKV